MDEVPSVYPDLNRFTEIKDYFIAEIRERELMT